MQILKLNNSRRQKQTTMIKKRKKKRKSCGDVQGLGDEEGANLIFKVQFYDCQLPVLLNSCGPWFSYLNEKEGKKMALY